MVEFGLVLPIILLIVIGVMEYGLAFKDWLSISNASREGARVAATFGDEPTADCEVLASISESFVAVRLDDLVDVQIFKAHPTTGNQTGLTNVYTYSGGDPTDCTNWSGDDSVYPASSRNTIVGTTPLDIVGVRVRLDHRWITNFAMFSGTARFDEITISRVEPEAFE